jgi:hypothetical protein
VIDILGIKSIFRFLVGGGDIFRSGRWLILVDFLVGREWRFYMSEFKHLLGGEQKVKIRDSETVFFGLMVRLYKLGVIGWVIWTHGKESMDLTQSTRTRGRSCFVSSTPP